MSIVFFSATFFSSLFFISVNAQNQCANFRKNDQYSDAKNTTYVVLTDLDNDGDLDAVCSNMGNYYSQVLINDGQGNFTDSGQELTQQGHGVGVADLNGDDSPDIFITCAGYNGNNLPGKVYFNDGYGRFSDSGQNLGDSLLSGNAVHLADIDTDGDIDAVVKYYQMPSIVYLNNGKGLFLKSDIEIPESITFADVDADGDPDIFSRHPGLGFKVFLNNGGYFKECRELIDSTFVYGSAAYADVDGDGDYDIFVSNGNRDFRSPTRLLINDGNGEFTVSAIKLTPSVFGNISAADMNGDGFPDILITSMGESPSLWINDGQGNLTYCNVKLGNSGPLQRAFTGDLNNDGLNDVFISNVNTGPERFPNEVWLNQGDHPNDLALKLILNH